MRSSFNIALLVLCTITSIGCDLANDQQTHAAASSAPVPQAPQSADVNDTAPTYEVATSRDHTGNENIREIEWDSLIPEDWRPDALMAKYNVDELSDDDPRAQQLLDELKALWKEAPVVPALEGQRVKLPGFVVPLEMDAKKINQFLLVPYYGACIHVPPPPANQTVHVVTREGKAYEGQLFDAVWVTGTMRVERLSSDLAEAGYRLEEAAVVPYE